MENKLVSQLKNEGIGLFVQAMNWERNSNLQFGVADKHDANRLIEVTRPNKNWP